MVRVNGLLEVAYIADTGADQSVIPSAMADSLRAVQPGLGIVPLDSPISVTLADGSVQVCEMEIVLDLELVTIAGAVNLRAVPCLVLEGEGDEVLLGKDALKRLGIVVDQTLAQLADSTLLEDEEEEYPVGDELPGDASIPITTLDELLDRTVANGLPHEHTTAVRDMLDLFPEIWRDAVSSGAAALREDARPYRSPPRKYAPLLAEFIREYVKSLVAEGLVTKNNAARWACAVVPVRKPGSRDKFRLTIDYRPVNRLTTPIAGVMPSTATVMEVLLGKKVFARFDLTHGFWQLTLHPDCQELFSFVTPDGVYTPNRVPQGAMDSALHFQSQMQTLLAPLIPHSALVWVDDVILFAPTVAEFLANLKVNMKKSSLFELEILLCGRYFSADGVRHDPMRMDALSTLPLPATVADLQRFVFTTNWLHDSLPDYARAIAPLHAKLEAEKKKIGKRNRNALQVATQWSNEERDAFKDVVSLVRDSALMVHPDPDADLCVFTDASLSGFSIVVTQGHRGQEAMVLALKARFYITKVEDKVAKFVRQCLLYKHVKGSRLIPRPYGPLLTPTERNEVVHWDFLSHGEGYGDSAYLLVVKNGLSHFCELFPCATPTAYVAAEALLMWAARYGIPKTLLSDQGAHFRNEMMRHMAARLKVEQNFTPVYSPWLNGAVERLNRDVLQVLRALLLEYALDYHECPYLLPALQANLDHTAVQSLAGHSPVEGFTGLPASSALDVVVAPASETTEERVIEIGDLGDQLENVRASLHQMHRDVTDAKERKSLQDMMTHKGTPVNFDVGDFVLWSRIDQRLSNNKLLGQW
uniref:Reverse transcriptase n=1 Tax=Phytophthora ramorum TaxID=164328 RepID=H3H7U3_PHYRM